MRATRRKNRGHNLLEAIIAGILFSVVTVFLMGIWDMQFKAMLKSKETAVASFLAERIMEECIAAGFEAVQVAYPQPYLEEIEVRSRTKKGENLTKYFVIVELPSGGDPGAHPDPAQQTVIVEVKYNDSTTKSDALADLRSVQFHTVLNEHG